MTCTLSFPSTTFRQNSFAIPFIVGAVITILVLFIDFLPAGVGKALLFPLLVEVINAL